MVTTCCLLALAAAPSWAQSPSSSSAPSSEAFFLNASSFAVAYGDGTGMIKSM